MSEDQIEAAAQSDPDSLLLVDCDMATLQVIMPKTKQSILAGLPVLVHLRRDFLACDKALWAQIAQPAVRSFRVVILSPILNNDASFA